MKAAWLHISDMHFRAGDPYDRDVVLGSLVQSVRRYRDEGRRPDLVFATGDVAHGGQDQEYAAATAFFDALIEAAGIEKRCLFVIPGNHDVDRGQGVGLARTLRSPEEADQYFKPGAPKVHIAHKQRAFVAWYNRYFRGIRKFPKDSSCGPMEVVSVGGLAIGILPLNSALFCQDDHDHNNLWIGRRCLDNALKKLERLGASINVALVHHPLDWLSDIEGANIKAALASKVDFVLRGHLHQTDVESVVGVSGETLNLAAGAAYQTRQWPNRALYAAIDGDRVTVFPIRYEDQPQEVWVVDPSVFPRDKNFERTFPIPRFGGHSTIRPDKSPEPPPVPVAPRRFQSNIPSRRNLPFVARDDLLEIMRQRLGDPARENVIVLNGQPGVGKSELAREFARREHDRYPGGTFFIDAGTGTVPVELARLGRAYLDLDFPGDLPLDEQAVRTLRVLGEAPALLVYDNAGSEDAIRPWLPPGALPCHVVITSVLDRWDSWPVLAVEPLSDAESLELVESLAGPALAGRHGQKLVALAGGLPVQIVPASATLAYEDRRGRGADIALTLQREASQSFWGVYEQLEAPVRLLLHAAARLNPQRIIREEIKGHLAKAAGWSDADFQRRLDACLDVHVLQGTAELRMHQLFASFMSNAAPADDIRWLLIEIERAQAQRMVELAEEVAVYPNRAEQAAMLMTYPLDPRRWSEALGVISAIEGQSVGSALIEIGQFAAALPWCERVVAETEKGDVHGRIDHGSLSKSLHLVGYCLSSTGEFAAARPWYERAVAEAEKGDVHGRIDHDSLGSSLHQVGTCLSSTGEFAAARPWYERAVAAKEKGDVHGRIDQASLGSSLHQVGYCLFGIGEFAAARPLFERAVAESEKGDAHGRIDHASLGASLHQVGSCLFGTGEFAAARPWFERAVAEAEKGDVHGRINHESLGKSLHLVGDCLSKTGEFAAARPWFERAVAAKEKGDVHGRIDHESLGKSLHLAGYCLSSTGEFAAARPWYERAVAEAEKGDVHGRIDHDSLGSSLHQVGTCLSSTGEFAAARPWYERAVAAKEKGDVHGRIDHESLGRSLAYVGHCLSSTGDFAAALPWLERAVAAQGKGNVHGRIDHASLCSSLHAGASCLRQLGLVEQADEWDNRATSLERRD